MIERTILITGAGGIGRAIALASAQRGWRVTILDIDQDAAEAVAEEALSAGAGKALAFGCDVSSEDSIRAAFDRSIEGMGAPDGVVANAGIEINAELDQLDSADWNRVIDVNLSGVFLTVRESIKRLLTESGSGSSNRHASIVCTSSPSAFVGFAGGGNTAYGASKGGISAFVRSVAIDYASRGIRVNGLVPGATQTPLLLAGLTGETKAARAKEITQNASSQIPLGRLADPAEIAAAALWLLSEESSYVTGSNLVCDGGLMAKSANNF